MGRHLSIQDDQDEAYLMASFPYLASANAEPDSFGLSPNTLNRVQMVKMPNSSILVYSNVAEWCPDGPEYYFSWLNPESAPIRPD